MNACQETPPTWETHWEKGEQLIQQGNTTEAETEFKAALQEVETFGESDYQVPPALTRLAAFYDGEEQYEKAQPLLEKALAIKETLLGPGHPETVLDLRNLGALYFAQHQFDQARPLFQHALSIRQRTLGPNHPEVLHEVKTIAGLHVSSQSQFSLAKPFLTRSLDMKKTDFKETDPEILAYLDNFERLNTAQQQYDKAKP